MSVALGVMAVATAVQGYSAYQQANASNTANAYNAELMKQNQQIREVQALFAEEKGARDETKFRLGLESLKGTQRAAYSSSGVVVGEGTAGLVVDDTAGFGELDAMTIRRNAEFEAYDIRAEGAQAGAKAGFYDAARVSPGLAAGTTLLSGGSQIASTYARSNSRGKK